MADTVGNSDAVAIHVSICAAGDALDRFGRVLRHLVVGLVDQAVRVNLVSADRRIEGYKLGPIQSIVHEPLSWPFGAQRVQRLLETLSPHPPTVVHAMSAQSYALSLAMAEAFDTDVVWQVTAEQDCEAAARLDLHRVGRFLVFSRPLMATLIELANITPERVALVLPGALAASEPACFADEGRQPTLLCLSPLERHAGVADLIEAVDLLKNRKVPLLAFLLGTGRHESHLRRMVRDRNLSSHVTFAGPIRDVTQAMQSADIFVHTTADAAFHGDLLQAMAMGMAVVACPSPAADFVLAEETAVVWDQPNAQTLAVAIERLIADRTDARRLASAGMSFVRQHHTASGMAERTVAAYRSLALARATFPI